MLFHGSLHKNCKLLAVRSIFENQGNKRFRDIQGIVYGQIVSYKISLSFTVQKYTNFYSRLKKDHFFF